MADIQERTSEYGVGPQGVPSVGANYWDASSSRPSGITPSMVEMIPSQRVGAELDTVWRVMAAVVGIAALVFGGLLAWMDKSDGIAVAGAFAVATVTLVFALMGVVPASVKMGDVEIKLQQAKEAGKQEGAVAGLRAAGELKELPEDQLQAELETAFTTPNHLQLKDTQLQELRVPNLGGEGRRTAEAIAQRLAVKSVN